MNALIVAVPEKKPGGCKGCHITDDRSICKKVVDLMASQGQPACVNGFIYKIKRIKKGLLA